MCHTFINAPRLELPSYRNPTESTSLLNTTWTMRCVRVHLLRTPVRSQNLGVMSFYELFLSHWWQHLALPTFFRKENPAVRNPTICPPSTSLKWISSPNMAIKSILYIVNFYCGVFLISDSNLNNECFYYETKTNQSNTCKILQNSLGIELYCFSYLIF